MKRIVFLIVTISVSFIAGIYFQKIASNTDMQKTKEQRYVRLKEDRRLVVIGESDTTINLPKGMIIYFDFSHKDFDSYASIPIKTDFDSFRGYIESTDAKVVYELK